MVLRKDKSDAAKTVFSLYAIEELQIARKFSTMDFTKVTTEDFDDRSELTFHHKEKSANPSVG